MAIPCFQTARQHEEAGKKKKGEKEEEGKRLFTPRAN